MITIILLIILVVLAAKAVEIIPTAHYGVVLRMKKRTGRTVNEGLNFKIPFIETITPYSYELEPSSIAVDVFSRDRLEIKIKGSLQWKVSETLLLTFVEIPNETIIRGLTDAVKSEIGKIAGSKEGDIFIRERGVLRHIINCVLRHDRMPHLHVNSEHGEMTMGRSFERWVTTSLSKISEGDCERHFGYGKTTLGTKLIPVAPEEWNLPTSEDIEELDVISFYKKNVSRIQLLIQLGELTKEISPIEKRYGISIVAFEIADVDFSEETKKAMEKARQTEAEMEASEKLKEKKIQLMREMMNEGLSAEAASNAADVLIGVAEKRKVFSIEGGGALPHFNMNEKGDK